MNKKIRIARLSIFSNSLLIILKFLVGILSGSVSIMSEAIHSSMDLVAAIIAFFSVRVSDNPPDERHPYGHGKFENLSGVLEALLILVAAGWIVYEAVHKMAGQEPVESIGLGSLVMFISAGVFVYFEEWKIKDFFIRLADRFKDFEMFFDVTSPKGVEIANQMILKSGINSDSFFKWGLNDKRQITSWDKRIHLFNTYYTYRIDGLELSKENQEIAIISDSLDIQYMIHLKVS